MSAYVPDSRPEQASSLGGTAFALGVGVVLLVTQWLLQAWVGFMGQIETNAVALAIPILAIGAVVTGIMATLRASRQHRRAWMGVVGLVVGSVALVLWVAPALLLVWMWLTFRFV
ncbi:MAG: hypothetical protein ACREN2_01690 [Candidatus Dormibacteria bacterium]